MWVPLDEVVEKAKAMKERQGSILLKVIARPCIYNGNGGVPGGSGLMTGKQVSFLTEAMILAIQKENCGLFPGKNQYREAVVGNGIVQVNRVTVVVDTAERSEDIDEVRQTGFRERNPGTASSETEYREYYMSKSIHGPCSAV